MERGVPNATCVAALVDRLLHHADVTVLEGDSYRVRASEQEAAKRRKKEAMSLSLLPIQRRRLCLSIRADLVILCFPTHL